MQREFDKQQLLALARQFDIARAPAQIQPYGSGHINDTFLVSTSPEQAESYLLQRVNHHVFKDVPALMDNVVKVTAHVRKKLARYDTDEAPCDTLSLIPANNGQYWVQDEQGGYWRMCVFFDTLCSYDQVTSSQQAYEAGRAFGLFQKLLSDLPGDALVETIPNFHNIDFRLGQFEHAQKQADPARLAHAREQIQFVEQHKELMREVLLLGEAGHIPLRVTHNDTKFNNVLLNQAGRAVCVIDLDTVMPGYVHYDYSDCLRTVTNTAAEDEQDLSKVKMDLAYFTAFNQGFLKQLGPSLNDAELSSLVSSAKLLPFIIGLRFLNDYLEGDHYYKTQYPDHNLVRAKTQFKLVQSMMAQESHMHQAVDDILESLGCGSAA